jgi:hypothetical protein
VKLLLPSLDISPILSNLDGNSPMAKRSTSMKPFSFVTNEDLQINREVGKELSPYDLGYLNPVKNTETLETDGVTIYAFSINGPIQILAKRVFSQNPD